MGAALLGCPVFCRVSAAEFQADQNAHIQESLGICLVILVCMLCVATDEVDKQSSTNWDRA